MNETVIKLPKKVFLKAVVAKYIPMMVGLRIPGFIRIHGRYAKRNIVTWFVLFIAPFIIGASSLSLFFKKILEVQPSNIQIYLIILFVLALAFFFAERHRKFRRIYVVSIPVMVVINGLFRIDYAELPSFGDLIVFAILTAFPAWWLGRHAMGKGYQILTDGADKDYSLGRDLFEDERFEEAFNHLEPSAKRGHMKSLYLMGLASEMAKGREPDRVLAARFYDRAGRKGYGKANAAFETLFETFTPEEVDAFEAELGGSGIEDLF